MSNFEESVLMRLKQLEDRIARLEQVHAQQAATEPVKRLQEKADAENKRSAARWDKGKK